MQSASICYQTKNLANPPTIQSTTSNATKAIKQSLLVRVSRNIQLRGVLAILVPTTKIVLQRRMHSCTAAVRLSLELLGKLLAVVGMLMVILAP